MQKLILRPNIFEGRVVICNKATNFVGTHKIKKERVSPAYLPLII